MRLALTQGTMSILGSALEKQTEFDGLRTKGAEWRVAAALYGYAEAEVLEAAREIIAKRCLTYNRVSAALLQAIGINPAIAIFIAEYCSPINLVSEKEIEVTLSGQNDRIVFGSADSPIKWVSIEYAFQIGEALPQTVLAMLPEKLPGKKLKSFLSHPELDRLDLEIQRIGQSKGKASIYIRRAGKLTSKELLTMLPEAKSSDIISPEEAKKWLGAVK